MRINYRTRKIVNRIMVTFVIVAMLLGESKLGGMPYVVSASEASAEISEEVTTSEEVVDTTETTTETLEDTIETTTEISVEQQEEATTSTSQMNDIMTVVEETDTTLEDLIISSDLTLTSDMTVNNLEIQRYTTLDLNGYILTVEGKTTINGIVRFNKGELICKGNTKVASTAFITMDNGNDYIIAYGNMTYYGTGELSAGTIEVKGNFTANNNFQPTDYHKVIFSGDSEQKVSVSDEGKFNNVELRNYSSAGITIVHSFYYANLTDNGCVINYADIGGERGYTLTDDTEYDGTYYLVSDTLNLDGHTMTINGDLIQAGGTININGGKLIVNGNYRVQSRKVDENNNITYGKSTGILNMTNESDYLYIDGDFICSTSADHTDKLTEGVMELTGDIIVVDDYSDKAFMSTDNHTIVVSGDEIQTISLKVPENCSAEYYSHLGNLIVNNTSEDGISFGTRVYVEGNVDIKDCNVSGVLGISSDTRLSNNTYNGDISIVGSASEVFDQDMTINGDVEVCYSTILSNNLTINGDISCCNYSGSSSVTLQGITLNVSGNSNKINYNMRNENDYVSIGGDLNLANYSSLMKGTIELKGNLDVKDINSLSSTHRFILSGDKLQTINSSIKFGIIELQNYSDEGVYSDVPLEKYELIRNGCNLRYGDMEGEFGWTLSDDITYDGNFVLLDDELNLNGYTFTVNGNFIQASGTVNTNGGKLIVNGDYRMQGVEGDIEQGNYIDGTGNIKMLSEDEIIIKGDLYYYSDNNIEDGTLILYGDLNTKDFKTLEINKVLFCGDEGQSIGENYGTVKIANVELDNSSAEGININGSFYVTKYIDDNDAIVNGTICTTGTVEYGDDVFQGSMDVRSGYAFFNDIHILGNLNNNATVYVYADNSLQIDGTFTNAGDMYLYGRILVNEDYKQVGAKSTRIVGGRLEIQGNFDMDCRSGKFYQTSKEDYIYVNENFNISENGNDVRLSNGILEIAGDVSINRSISIGTDHKLILSGDTLQTVDMYSGNTWGIIELQNYSEEGVFSETVFSKNQLIRNGCRLRYGDCQGEFGWTLSEDQVWEGDLIIIDDTLDLNGHTLTVKGNLIQQSGDITINGGKLIVEEDYRMQTMTDTEAGVTYSSSASRLVMEGEDDYVLINGDYIVNTVTSQKDCLKLGTVEIKGDIQIDNKTQPEAFCFDKTATLILSGDKKQTISTTNNKGEIILGNVKVNNTSADKVSTDGKLQIYGVIDTSINSFEQPVYIKKGGSFADGVFYGDVILDNYMSVDEGSEIIINGNCEIDTTLTVGGKLYINGNLSVDAGGIKMEEQDAYVRVQGDFSSSIYMDDIVDGTLEVTGNISATSNFYIMEKGKLVLSGEGKQSIDVTLGSSIETMEIRNTSDEGVYSSNYLHVSNLMDDNLKLTIGVADYKRGFVLTEDTTISGDYYLGYGVLDLNGHKLNIEGNLVHAGGTIDINGGELTVSKNYLQKVRAILDGKKSWAPGWGVLIMDDTEDELHISGNVDIDPIWRKRVDELVDGNIYVEGNLTFSKDVDYSRKGVANTSNNNCVHLIGDNQTVKGDAIKFANLHIGTKNTLKINADVKVTDSLVSECQNVNGEGAISIDRFDTIKSDVYYGNLILTQADVLSSSKTIKGELRLQYGLDLNGYEINCNSLTADSTYGFVNDMYKRSWDLNLNGGRINCLEDFQVSGTTILLMQDSNDYICVGGDFNFSSTEDHTNKLTAGTLELKGDFTDGSETFKPSGDHRTVLGIKYKDSGKEYIQTITFKDKDSLFNTLVLKKDLSKYVFSRDVEDMAVEVIYDIQDIRPAQPITNIKTTAVDMTTVTLEYQQEDNAGTIGYIIYRDGERIASTGVLTYKDYDLEPNTTYTYEVYPVNSLYEQATEAPKLEVTTYADIEGPTAPANLSITGITGSSIQLSWSASTDNLEVVGYEVYRDGESIAVIAYPDIETTYRDINIQDKDNHIYTVLAYDEAGNTSPLSTEVAGKTVMPVITKAEPTEYSQLSNRSQKLIVYFKNMGYGANYTLGIQYRSTEAEEWTDLDTSEVKSATYNAQTYMASYDWDTSSLTASEYEVKFILSDEDGNTTSQIVNYYVDNVAPALPENIKITSQSGVLRLNWDASISYDCDGYNIYRREYNSEEEYSLVYAETNNLVEAYTDIDVEEGVFYEYALTAVDTSGNESYKSESVKAKVVPDEEPPTIESVTPEAGRISGKTQVTITARDNKKLDSVSVSYRKEGTEEWINLKQLATKGEAVTYELDTTGLEDGIYYYSFTATDAIGNTSIEEYTRRYEVDNTGISKINITDIVTGSTYVQLKWDDVPETDFAYFQVEQYVKGVYKSIGTVSNVLGYTVEGLTPNTAYRFRVVGYDTMGNRGECSDIRWVYTDNDTVAPTINAIYPSETYHRNNMTLKLSATDNYGIGYATFSYSHDGETYIKIADVKTSSTGKTASISKTLDISDMPEGKLYIKYEVYDKAGNKNALTADGEDIINEYIIDRTAPSKPENLMAMSKDGYIALTWDKPTDTDIAGYKIYRADVEDGIFQLVRDNLQNSTYNDANIEPGRAYIYRMIAVDKAGNTSEYSNQCTASAGKDKTAPYIAGVSLADKAMVGEDAKLTIIARDNAKLSHIEVDIKDDAEGIWINLDNKSASGSIYQTELDLKLDHMPEGEYTYRIRAVDEAGNQSDYLERTYVLDTTPAVATLEASTGDLCINLTINLPEDKDFSYVDVYRRRRATEDETSEAFTKIYTGKTTAYKDEDITPWQEYEYKLESYDQVGNCHISDIVSSYGTDNDTINPVAVLPDSIRVLEGMEIQLDGGESSDNVGIKSYQWELSDGTTYTGRRITHSFSEKGVYDVNLTVKDAAGNASIATTQVQVIERDGAGTIDITVVDSSGTPVPYAYVYLNDSLNTEKSYKTDSAGRVTISAKRGEYLAAAYKTGYIPKDIEVTVSEHETYEYIITIPKGDIVVGDFSIHKMSLQEMVEAGVDFSAPENMHRYTFEVELQFAEAPIPVEIVYIYDGTGAGTFGGNEGGVTDNFIIDWGGGRPNDKASVQVVQPVVGEEVIEEPIIVTVRTVQTVSWLKDMYSVELGVLNTADSKYVIEDSFATINLPQGLSLTATYSGQSATTYMGSIAGQERKTTTWIVNGDTPGDYQISADFSGNLTPFNCPVNAHFTCNQTIGVSDYSGLEICIMPEATAYTGEEYYIQFSVTNDTGRPLYNFTTSFGPYMVPGVVSETYVIQPGSEEKELYDSYKGSTQFLGEMSLLSQTPVITGDERLSIATLSPGQTIYGTYSCGFPGVADPTEYYYTLTDAVVNVLQGNELGVSVTVMPISGHVSKRIVKGVIRESMFGDPVDVATGAYIDNYEAISLTGRDVLSLDLYYNSLDSGISGELGYGWSHNFESYVVEDMGMIHYYTSPATCASFVNEDSLNGIKYGTMDGNTLSLSSDTGKDTLTFRSITTGMDGYVLTKNPDGTYAMTTPAGYVYEYGTDGKLTKMTMDEGRSVTISHAVDQIIVTEDATGNRLKLDYAGGRLISVTDNTGRTATFAYTEGYLTSITNPIGETVNYEYDESGRLTVGKNHNGSAFVTNTYDELGRVVKQSDDRGCEIGFTYTDTDKGTITECKAADGSVTTVESDLCGNITKVTTPQGAVTTHEYDRLSNKVKSVDAYGNTYSYTYDEKGNLTAYTSDISEGVSITYDDKGNIISTSSIDGALDNTGAYTYDESGNLIHATDGQMTCSYSYDDNGNLISIERVGRGTTSYTYDDKGLFLASATGENGYISYMDYDNRGNLIMTRDASGAETRYEYDQMNRRTKTIYPNGGEVGYTYDLYGNITSVTDPMGYVTSYGYDVGGRHISTTYADGSVESFSYDEMGNLTAVTASDGRKITYEHDGLGNVTKITYPDGTTEECTYDMLGQITSSTDILGHKSVYNYDSTGTLSSITSPDGQTLTATYGNGRQIEKMVDGTGKSASYTYDSKGNVTSMTDTLGNTVTYEYNSWGEMLTETDANGNKTTYTYDNAGQCTAVTNPDGTTTNIAYDPCGRVSEAYIDRGTAGRLGVSYTYDSMGNVSTYTDEMGNTTSYEYDLNGNLIKVTDSEGLVTAEYTYDCMGKVLQEKTASGIVVAYSYNKSDLVEKAVMTSPTGEEKVYAYTYDDMDRVLSVTDPAGNVSSQSYDLTGNVTELIYPEGGGIEYGYDSLGRLTSETLSIGTTSTYEYNADSLLSKITNGRGQETDYSYDDLGRISSFTDEMGTVSYTYDGNGNVLTVSEKLKDGTVNTVTRTYDCMDRVTSYTDYQGNTVKYGYDELGNLISLTYPGGEIVRYDYDSVGLLTTVTDSDGLVTSYSYDKLGRLISTTKPDDSVETNSYDKLSRLSERIITSGKGETIAKYSYVYDSWGNIVSITSEGTTEESKTTTLTSATMTYDSSNRMVTYNGEDILYDEDGNMVYGPLDGVMTEFEYDCRNRLIRAGDTYYEYDAENVRTATETPEYREEYVTNSVGQLSSVLVIERTYKNETRTETEEYVYGNGLIYEESSEVGLLVYHFNHLGSTTAITDEDGKLVYGFDYGTYGELITTTEYSDISPIIRFKYNGQLGVSTDDNGLYYMRFRYYNPEIKRFINQDILTGNIGNSNSLNRYSYVEGNPVSYIDPFGLSPFSFLNVFNPSMIVHTALDILGCLPGGAIFDVANAAIYFMEDNETEAWKCVFFAIPGADLVGKGAKWGAKLGGKGGKIVEQTMKSIDFAGHLGSTYFAASDFGNGIAFMIDKYMVGEAEFSSDTVWEFASLAGHGFQLRSFSGSFLNNAKAGNYGSTLMEASTTDLSLNSMFGEGSVFNYFVHDNSGRVDLDELIGTGSKDGMSSGLVEIKAPPNATPAQIAQVKAYVDGCNEALMAGKLSNTGRVSTQGSLRRQASRTARKEAQRAINAGTPYMGHVGHVPDTTWTGTPEPYDWLDLDPIVNTSLGGQSNGYPIGYKPTGFVFKEDN